jgi:hypothetical protein
MKKRRAAYWAARRFFDLPLMQKEQTFVGAALAAICSVTNAL